MLSKIFDSPSKIKLLQYYVSNQAAIMAASDAGKKAHVSPDTARKICKQLANLGVLHKEQGTLVDKRGVKKVIKGYRINTSFPLYRELQALFIKSQLLFEGDLVKQMQRIGGAVYVVLTGVFTAPDHERPTDILIVGKVNRDKLGKIISSFEKKLGFEINYTVMSRSEYSYRRDITDRFLYSILEAEHLVILDKLYGSD